MRRWVILVLLLCVVPGGGALAEEIDASMMTDLPELVRESDLVVLGRVVRLYQELRETEVKIEVLEVFKGDTETRYVRVKYHGGKFLVDNKEPFFSSTENAILFLKAEEDYFRCVFGKEGKKTVRNENVYVHPDNNFLTMKLKKYRPRIIQAVEESKYEEILLDGDL